MNPRQIEITRTSQHVNKARDIRIYINNKKVDVIGDGESKRFYLDTNENEVYAKIDWCKTKHLKITVKENETVKLELGSNLSGWKLLLLLPYYIILNPSEYLYLKQK